MRMIVLLFALLFCACGENRPPAPTAEEAEQLNEAEDLLNEQVGEIRQSVNVWNGWKTDVAA